MIEIKAPVFPESIADGEVAAWHVAVGEQVSRDQVLVDIETDKVVLEIVAPADGALTKILKEVGDTVLAEEVLAQFEEGEGSGKATEKASTDKVPKEEASKAVAQEKEAPKESAAAKAGTESKPSAAETDDQLLSPAARKIAEESKVNVAKLKGTGKGGRITKEDVLKAVAAMETAPASGSAKTEDKQERAPAPKRSATSDDGRVERRVPMTRLRSSIARRLVEAQQTAAILSTFNEVDMSAIMDLRSRYKEDFEKAHNGTRLGFMSFFVRASVEALKRFPSVNASIDDNDVVYHGYQDIGVAVGSPRGLVVPVLRDADSLTLAEIEDQIREFGVKARDNKLSIEDMTGGTFTISNGGVFGSLLSTPILNPPQTGILGMHKIQERPMAINGQVEIRPMMYLALSYDHRLIDGQEAVRFLVTIKDFLEEPARILLDI